MDLIGHHWEEPFLQGHGVGFERRFLQGVFGVTRQITRHAKDLQFLSTGWRGVQLHLVDAQLVIQERSW